MSQQFQSFADIMAHLDSLGLFHMDMRLGRMEHALAALNLRHPLRAAHVTDGDRNVSRAPFVVAQVLGTNGKGSTATFLASLCAANGCKVGLYTSPHFVSPTERIRINGQPVPGAEWVEPANRIMAVTPELTYFEFLTVLAVLLFTENGVDVAVLEAGLGGHYDATTAVACDSCCFVPIAMDHADILGHTIQDIANDKAHAIRSAAPVFSGQQFPLVADVLQRRASQYAAPLTFAAPLPAEHYPALGLSGAHQYANAGLALACWRFLATRLGKTTDTAAEQRGMAGAFIPGRLQLVPATPNHPALLLDGAHNPHGTRSLVQYLASTNLRPCACVYSCLHDKEWRPSLAMLGKALGHVPLFVPAIDNPRAENPDTVAAFYASLPHAGPTAPEALALQGADAVAKALHMAAARYISNGGPLLVCGSLYLLAELFTLHPEFLQNPSMTA